MARNRKRAKDRRARRPQGAPVGTGARADLNPAPDPIEHASPDAELAEAQLAVGRPQLAADGASVADPPDPVTAEPEPVAFEPEPTEAPALPAGELPGDVIEPDEAEPRTRGEHLPAARAHPGSRLVHFVQGSWRELQRVQWPDRRQVMQATGVVIGFVIVAGVFLGVTDFLAGKVMNYVLTGHFK